MIMNDKFNEEIEMREKLRMGFMLHTFNFIKERQNEFLEGLVDGMDKMEIFQDLPREKKKEAMKDLFMVMQMEQVQKAIQMLQGK